MVLNVCFLFFCSPKLYIILIAVRAKRENQQWLEEKRSLAKWTRKKKKEKKPPTERDQRGQREDSARGCVRWPRCDGGARPAWLGSTGVFRRPLCSTGLPEWNSPELPRTFAFHFDGFISEPWTRHPPTAGRTCESWRWRSALEFCFSEFLCK